MVHYYLKINVSPWITTEQRYTEWLPQTAKFGQLKTMQSIMQVQEFRTIFDKCACLLIVETTNAYECPRTTQEMLRNRIPFRAPSVSDDRRVPRIFRPFE